ncbi:hypothetical protein CC1G_13727 [Coprinopsis cinerea okayama7|uniref:Uncharacterized protein n=1 Tax=Coprinopsis cinerea (strain Okayama-7 / 130 / ATCC MYA-4618 / FGSC 9003) TaxID=240176 RepID=D6RK68_COPC7|nr:hypothetical protein CC1G_13727 [Coprinopsis cinerea okayama7\|eukprot:XP_002912195.1 hypothetical protein CC1G_13727 [Coprinopsis cinerea okayama7\
MADSANINGTSRSSATSSVSPTWGPPKSPLAPERLAKLANALGVSTPIPPTSKPSGPPFLSRSFSDFSGPPESLRRSPTPSVTSSAGFNVQPPPTSRYLLHVIPPMHLPHDPDTYDSVLTPPPPTASGYHTQFRRGTLVPVHSTLQAQLGAIAKEYALPSTAGLILYLVSSGSSTRPQSPTGSEVNPMLNSEGDEPGPRLSEEIWRHLWYRVIQAEQRDGNMLLLPSLSRSPTPLLSPTAARSTPFLVTEFNANLRLPASPISPRPTYPSIASPSTPSSVSDLRSSSKSAPPSESAAQSEPDTPDTSVDVHDSASVMRANSLDLPGLGSTSLIPILAKVEFDIDTRKAAWYKPWLRSRKVNHAKRNRSRNGKGENASGESGNEKDEENAKAKEPAIPLLMGKKKKGGVDALLKTDLTDDATLNEGGYEQLTDSDSDSDDDLEFAEDSTAKDPLEDVFGSDADTWAEMKAERGVNPNVVDLALTGEELTRPDDSFITDDNHFTREEEEVREMLDRMSQGGRTPDPFMNEEQTSPTLSKKHVPAPLVIVPNPNSEHIISTEPSPAPTASLSYLEGDSPAELQDDDDYGYRAKSPTESEKRSGALFEDLDLGLDPSEDYDDNDPNDRRRSQYVMKAQLDEIERTLAQLSPRILKTDLDDDVNQSFSSATLSPNSPAKLTLSPLRNSDLSPAPRLPQHPDPPNEPTEGASWPAIPFSLIKNASESESNPNRPPSPPQLAVNGITTSAPRSFIVRNPSGEVSSETIQRKKELEEEQALYGKNRKNSIESPVIPLSPDPFGRYSSSTPENVPVLTENGSQWDTVTLGRTSMSLGEDKIPPPGGRTRSGTTISRFSADSLLDEPAPTAAAAKSNRGTLMSVKSIKNLWRKSNKGDKDKDKEKDKEKNQPPPVPNGASASGRVSPGVPPKRSSGRVSPGVPLRPERPSQENLDLPDVPALPAGSNYGRFSPQPGMNNRPPSRASQESSRRPSGEMSRTPSMGSNRPSMDYSGIPQNRRPSMDQRPQESMPPLPPPMMNQQGLSVPFANRGNNNSPIIPTQMLPSRTGGALDRLHFDQESPYPNPIRTVRYAPRTPSPPQQQLLQQQQQHFMQQQQQQGQLASIPEQQQQQEQLARKSILKWKSSAGANHHSQEYEPRSSFDRTSYNGAAAAGGPHGGRKASVTNFTSDMPPPSPFLPDHLAAGGMGMDMNGGPSRAPSAASYAPSFDPRPTSPSANSFTSDRSIDSSQFEIVSPRMGSGLPYPSTSYHHGSQES